jgi:hypothetical protein
MTVARSWTRSIRTTTSSVPFTSSMPIVNAACPIAPPVTGR